MTKPTRRRGRPEIAAEPGTKTTIGIVASADLKRRLSSAAKSQGKSLSQEAERRLDQSLKPATAFGEQLELIYGSQGVGLLVLIGDALRYETARAGRPIDTDWLRDPTAYARVVEAIIATLDHLRPEGEPPEWHGESPRHAVHRTFLGLADDTYLPMKPRRERLRRFVGDDTFDQIVRRTEALSQDEGEAP